MKFLRDSVSHASVQEETKKIHAMLRLHDRATSLHQWAIP